MNQFCENDLVICTNLLGMNIEGLTKNRYYTVLGVNYSEDMRDPVYALKDMVTGKIKYARSECFEKAPEKPKFNFGEKVKIVARGKTYSTYHEWFEKMGYDRFTTIDPYYKPDKFKNGDILFVMDMHKHFMWPEKQLLYMVGNDDGEFTLIGEEGIEKVETVTKSKAKDLKYGTRVKHTAFGVGTIVGIHDMIGRFIDGSPAYIVHFDKVDGRLHQGFMNGDEFKNRCYFLREKEFTILPKVGDFLKSKIGGSYQGYFGAKPVKIVSVSNPDASILLVEELTDPDNLSKTNGRKTLITSDQFIKINGLEARKLLKEARKGTLKMATATTTTATTNFKVGDIITGKSDNGYGVTTANALMEVLESSGESIKVKILKHKTTGSPVGMTFSGLTASKFVKFTGHHSEFKYPESFDGCRVCKTRSTCSALKTVGFTDDRAKKVKEEEEKKTAPAPFNVGDLVTGKPETRYSITTKDALMRVETIRDEYMTVKVLKHRTKPLNVGDSLGVEPKYFVKTTEEEFTGTVPTKFNVGDLITATEEGDHNYSWTTSDALMKVKKITGPDTIVVEIVDNKKYKSEIGNEYPVNAKYFKKITEREFKTPVFKVGDLVTGTSENTYGFTNSSALMKVEWVRPPYIGVKILNPLGDSGYTSSSVFTVDPYYFNTTTEEEFAKHTGIKIASKPEPEKESLEAVKKSVIDHPEHYTSGRVEVIDIIDDATKDLTGIKAVCLGNILKYLLRHTKKNGLEDLKKARWYLNRLIDTMEKETTTTK